MTKETFSWDAINKPVLVLAPMANITTLPFRSICKEMGADIVFTPMFSANAIIHNAKKTLALATFRKTEQPVIVQIFGYDGETLARAANIVQERLKPAGIDINMGCPAPKVTGNESGSALLRDYDNAFIIIKKVRESFEGQLSVKVRLGWSEKDVLPFLIKLEKIGIDAISVHGRTTKEGYHGKADWLAIEAIISELNIPVIGNGDIDSLESANIAFQIKGIAGIMIGRGSLGNPWLFKTIKEQALYKPTLYEFKDIILRQTNLSIEYLDNEERAIREMRKHLGWYLKKFGCPKELRVQAVRANSIKEVIDLLSKID
ncbi:MAG: tRNA-dihydrouridine synthase family protein [bacterium]